MESQKDSEKRIKIIKQIQKFEKLGCVRVRVCV